jgi:BRCT domain type II-containing protein
MVKSDASAGSKTAEASLPIGAGKPAPKAKRVRKPAMPKAEKPPTARRTTTSTKTSRRSKSASANAAYTNEDIALRAYFISQKRQQLGQYGSPESDWLEAERQLREGLPV